MSIDIVLDALDTAETNINSNITNCIKFLDTKQNMIMDGDFTKIIYSDDMVTMNGLYFACPLTLKTTEQYTQILQNPLRSQSDGQLCKKSDKVVDLENANKQNKLYSMENKNIIWFYPYHNQNEHIIRVLSNLEKIILEEYMRYVYGIKVPTPPGLTNKHKPRKTPIYSLHNQLLSGNMKYYNKNTYPNNRRSNGSLHTECEKPMNKLSKMYVIKISGIWESSEHVGITYKLLETMRY
jgi:hypothetical protein